MTTEKPSNPGIWLAANTPNAVSATAVSDSMLMAWTSRSPRGQAPVRSPAQPPQACPFFHVPAWSPALLG